jgi:apolipoprotein N-acyltransferase
MRSIQVKNNKTVTPAVLAANSKNAKQSTDPKTEQGKEASTVNAVQHRVPSLKLHFSSHEEKTQSIRSRVELMAELHPKGNLQRVLVDENATTHQKRKIAVSLEMRETSRHCADRNPES